MIDQAAATIIFIWTVGVLVLKMQFVAFCTSLNRKRTGSPVVPEDEALLGRKEHSTPSGQSIEVERYLNLHRNDMENIYVFFFVSFFFIFSSNSADYAYDAWTAYNLTFLISRLAFTLCYIFSLQPWRTVAFLLGQLSTTVFTMWMMVSVIIAYT